MELSIHNYSSKKTIDTFYGLKKSNTNSNKMKKYLLFIAVIAVIAGCTKKEANNDAPIDIFNGYGHLKGSEPTAILWAGKNTNVGTVTYGIDDDGHFTATYNLIDGWEMSESHLYAGTLKNMPLNKPGNPKIGRFPYAEDHSPKVSTYTYYIDLTDLPPYADPGFTTAAHAVVHGPNGQEETAWRDGDHDFPGKRWGWYDDFYYDDDGNSITVLYGTEQTSDGTLNVYLIDVTNNTSTHILSENIGTQGTRFDGTAFDEESGYFFFVDYNLSELKGINLNDESDVETLGTLSGTVTSATYYNGNYYYVDNNTNELIEVEFDNNMIISSQQSISNVPETVTVQDITIDPNGTKMYMIGNVGSGSTELLELNMVSDVYSSLAISISQNAQISYGSDEVLYVVEPSPDNSGSTFYSIDPNTGNITEIEENEVIIVDPFLDLAKGPIM